MRKTLLAVLALALFVPGPAWAATPTTVDDYLRQARDATDLPGVSAVVTHGEEIVKATGSGHESTGAAVTADTPMRVASLSKSMTAAAVLTLVDEGRVALDQPVVTYLPEFRTTDPRTPRITVRHLLNQTSGLSDRTLDIPATQEATDLEGYLAALRDGELAAEPGTHWEYCNVNFDVAARLVEVVDGRDFAEAIRQRVFEPLGMHASAIGASASPGYNSVFGAWVSRSELRDLREGGSGGVVTTAADMGRWLISQTGRGPRILSPESLATLHQPWPGGDYAMGWGVEDLNGRKVLMHNGNLFTYSAIQAFDPATGDGYAVMTNSSALYEDTYDILVGLDAITRGKQPEPVGGGRQWTDLGLAVFTLVATGLGALGVIRSGRWARRERRARWWRASGLLLPVLVLVTYPQWVSFLANGRTVTWAQLTYFTAPLTIALGVAAAAALATAVARLIRWRAVRAL
ncbi:serine hydrolase domain-containing protein [Actinoplanes couchii]|uniref:Serine hydrolase n=1 Tax=Actinoplanes couchii TaxID=403638 RepID=A0ABQ3X2A9_9ACTN|nr:serine hydrolase domain-containing protein [Actinoplanes couchii]MDR6316996.1 CubicO group peptidase (beta-lactamase class C family) [Actinoplanes couchii]GID52604.1 serine hydrolase [Actinoplanes couchii]